MQQLGLAQRFAAIVSALGPPRPWALAVSGGPDSMALLHLAADVSAGRDDARPTVLTVDHGLRREAAAETRQVAAWAAALGLPCRILAIRETAPAAGLQAWARQHRYRLLAAAALDLSLASIFTAHTEDDQRETLALRRARGSGPLGLAGMPSQSALDSVRLVRPLLTTSKAELLAYLLERGQAFLTDPSNADPRFDRARLRQAGVPPLDIPELCRRQQARIDLENQAIGVLEQSDRADGGALLTVARQGLASLETELLDTVLCAILRQCGGLDYPGTRAERARLIEAIRAQGLFSGRTLARTRIRRVPGTARSALGETLAFSPEFGGPVLRDGPVLPFGAWPQLLADGRVSR